jgi:nanoRNase/pAp phosphatase (c-di-AMP/oligoRNAs hydrolase)
MAELTPEIYRPVADKLAAASSVLIILPPLATPDAIASGLALSQFLKKGEKDSVVVAADGKLNPSVDFLPSYGQVLRELSVGKSFIIDVSTKRASIAELSYKKDSDKLSIYLKPRNGTFESSDVTFRTSSFPYDAVVVLGVDRLESLGEFYARNAELFFETPVINMDFRGSNQGFGQFNLVQVNATSLSEIVFDLISEMEREMIDSGIATSLLAGIIAETNSFQHGKTTPAVFQKASQLVSLGGDQQDVVNKMYKHKSLGFLKLWGRVLARMRVDPGSQIVYSEAGQQDVEKSGASSGDVAAILKEMSLQLTFAKVMVFFRELDAASTEVYISAPASLNLASAFSPYQPDSASPHALHFQVPSALQQAQQQVMEVVRKEAEKLK